MIISRSIHAAANGIISFFFMADIYIYTHTHTHTHTHIYHIFFIHSSVNGVGSSFLCEGFSLVAASGGHSSSRCVGLSLSRPLLLRSTGCRRAGSVVVAHGLSCSAACGIFPDQGSNLCSLHWQADSQPLCHQGSPMHLLEL